MTHRIDQSFVSPDFVCVSAITLIVALALPSMVSVQALFQVSAQHVRRLPRLRGAGHGVVVQPAANPLVQAGDHSSATLIQVSFQILLDVRPDLFHRLHARLHVVVFHSPSLAAPPLVERESQEVEALLGGIDHLCLLDVQLELHACQYLVQFPDNSIADCSSKKDKVISISDDPHVFGDVGHPVLHQLVHQIQIDVRQQRGDHSPLRRTASIALSSADLPVFLHGRFQPLFDQV